MQVQVAPLLTAPQVTGHPHGLPGAQPDPMEHTRVKPVADARDPEARMQEGQAPTKFWGAVIGEPDPASHTAPPSIMQITISRMLDEQNPAKRDQAEPEPADTRRADRATPGFEPTAREAVASQETGERPETPAPRAQSPEDSEARSSVFTTLP